MQANKYLPLFTPVSIGKMELKNRIVFPPLSTFLTEEGGSISNEGIEHYAARARGGAAMVCTEAVSPVTPASKAKNLLDVSCPRGIKQFAKLAEAVHAHDAKLCIQISGGWGRVQLPGGEAPVSASEIPYLYDPSISCRALSVPEIEKTVADMAQLAANAALCGADAVNIHAHNGYLIDQFMSPQWNKRTDAYGGSMEKRLKFPIDIMNAIRAAVGPNIPIIFRLSVDQMLEDGNGVDESIKMMRILQEKSSVDAFDVDIAVYERIDYMFPPYYYGDSPYRYVAEACKKAGPTLPILSSGNHTPEAALDVIESGDADVVMFARPLLADPELPNKLLRNQRESVRPCIRCNDYCLGNALKGLGVSCAVNTQVGNDARNQIIKSGKPLNVAVVGGGPGGLEAARVAALKGHKVTLYEKQPFLGGVITAAATPPFKSQLREFIGWAEAQVKELGVGLRLNKTIEASSPELAEADAVIVAVGSLEIVPRSIPGIDGENVVGVIEAHHKPELVKGENVVVAGGGLSGCDFALELAMQGKKVTIVEMADQIAREILFLNAIALKNKLDEYGVTVLTGHTVKKIDTKGVYAAAEGKDVSIPADTVVSAFGCVPNAKLAREIREAYPHKTRLVGDCQKVAKVGEAVRAGFFAANALNS